LKLPLFSSITTRQYFLLLFLFVLGLLLYGYYLQYVKNLFPCNLCILQRFGFIGVCFTALAAALHNPGLLGQRIYLGLGALSAGLGMSVGIRQIILQKQPPKLFSECGSDLNSLLNNLPLSDVFNALFYSSGDCSKVDWTFLGFSIAEWSVAMFALIILSLVLVFFGHTKPD